MKNELNDLMQRGIAHEGCGAEAVRQRQPAGKVIKP